ncbi:MAG TPA: GNAT family N-acetyltransferase [Pseudonocardiaceae bacterium]|jgi:RimJ/RimL family protein N-acetyltransferase|nr:GNAT family N-acetyltransferase [Pseudonocardiaceae bacterium]
MTLSSGTGRIVAGELALEPLDQATAQRIAGGGDPGFPVGAGWPHADTMDGLSMVTTGQALFWLVTVDGVVIGDAGTHGGVDEAGRIEIGYGLAAPFRGRGHGRALVRALTESLLGRPEVRAVIAETEPANLPSRRALESAGFELVSADAQGAHYRRAAA